jgi:hypothetical protein
MIFSENRYPLFGIMRSRSSVAVGASLPSTLAPIDKTRPASPRPGGSLFISRVRQAGREKPVAEPGPAEYPAEISQYG